MPAEGGRSEVCESEDVETTAQSDTSDTVQTGEGPGDLGLVDGKMRGDGTLEALLDEDLFGILLGSGLGVCESATASASRGPGACVLMG